MTRDQVRQILASIDTREICPSVPFTREQIQQVADNRFAGRYQVAAQVLGMLQSGRVLRGYHPLIGNWRASPGEPAELDNHAPGCHCNDCRPLLKRCPGRECLGGCGPWKNSHPV